MLTPSCDPSNPGQTIAEREALEKEEEEQEEKEKRRLLERKVRGHWGSGSEAQGLGSGGEGGLGFG